MSKIKQTKETQPDPAQELEKWKARAIAKDRALFNIAILSAMIEDQEVNGLEDMEASAIAAGIRALTDEALMI